MALSGQAPTGGQLRSAEVRRAEVRRAEVRRAEVRRAEVRRAEVRRAVQKLGLAVALTLAVGAGTSAVHARPPAGSTSAQTQAVTLVTLPDEAQRTYRLIQAGGPFPYPKDGIVFGNRERQLPARARGYYHEYTVKTPGSHNRGARRIVCGGAPPATPEACYYTADHYTSFRHIVE